LNDDREKGGSGLVFYTDAIYWDKQKGDFDERTFDDWDVEYKKPKESEENVENALTILKKRTPPPEETFNKQNTKKLKIANNDINQREQTATYYDPKTESEPIDPYGQNVGEFERHTRGIGSKIMEKYGWRKGQGLGPNPKAGILHPVLVTPNPHTWGLGFVLIPFSSETLCRTSPHSSSHYNTTQHFFSLFEFNSEY
jgi:hypothetical protein